MGQAVMTDAVFSKEYPSLRDVRNVQHGMEQNITKTDINTSVYAIYGKKEKV